MKKLHVVYLIFVICLTSIAVTFAGNNGLSQWTYYKEIQLIGNNKYKIVPIDDEVYRYAKSDLSDLRITDEKGGIVPYYIENERVYSDVRHIIYSSRLLHSYKEKNDTITDFNVIPQEQGSDILADKLKFTVNPANSISRDFLKNIEVYGSYDGVKWQFVMNDNIYSVQNAEKNVVELPQTFKFNYYRIKAVNDLDNFKLNGMDALYNNIKYGQDKFEKRTSLKYSVRSDSSKTYIEIDNLNKLKINGIKLDIEGNFKRDYNVNVIDQNSVSTVISSGYIYNLNFKDFNVSNTYINNFYTPAEKLQIVIFNNDDKPLKIKDVQVNYTIEKIVFDGSQGTSYKLYFGNQNAQKPIYDVESYSNHIEKENQDECTLGNLNGKAQETVPDYRKVFNIVVVLVSLSLAGLIFTKVMAKAKNNVGKTE